MQNNDLNLNFFWKDYFEISNNPFSHTIVGLAKLSGDYGILSEKEYKLLVDLYSLFVASFKKGSNGELLAKTISALQNELTFLVGNFGFPYSKFLQDIDVPEDLLSEIFLNRLKKSQLDFQKKMDKSNKKQPLINLIDFMEGEINHEYTHKVKTELVLKLLIYLWDEKTLWLTLSNKMQGILKNTGLKLVLNGKQTWEDMNNILIFEMLRGLRPYREKLLSGYGHTSKILSYMDRIARNVCLTSNQKIVNNSFEMYGLTTENDATSDDSRGDDISEFSNAYMSEAYEQIKEMKKDAFVIFNSWNYTLKYFENGIASLGTKQVHKLHSFPLSDNLNVVLDKSWFYFFDKEARNHRLYGKIFHSYFDLVFLLHYEKKMSVGEIMNFLFSTPTLKFAVRVFDQENEGEVFFYEIKESDFEKLINIPQYIDDFKRRIGQLAKMLDLKCSQEKQQKIVVALGQLYKIIVATERLFIASSFEQLYNDHNIAYCYKLIEKQLKNTQQYLKYLVDLVEDKSWDKVIIQEFCTDRAKKLTTLLKKHFYAWNNSTNDKNYLKLYWKLKSNPDLEGNIYWKLVEILSDEVKEQILSQKENIEQEIKNLKNSFALIANENNVFFREEMEQKKKDLLEKFKASKKWKAKGGFIKRIEFTEEEMQLIAQYNLLDEVDAEDENFLPSSRFYGAIQYLF